ncbi:MAG: restriction endonuclease subunit S [Emticicia sp.]
MKYRLGDICTITKGETGIMKAIDGAYMMVTLGEANKTHNAYQFDTKAVIIPLVSSTGHGHASMKRVKYHDGKFALGSILCAVIPKNENFVLAKYLHIYLHWNREELLVSQMKGMANVSLPMNKIADVIVTVPSLEKQKEIVELEKKLVEKELEADKLYTHQLTLIENLNQAILQEAVQGKLVPQDPTDEPASQLLERIKAEKGKTGKKEKPLPLIKKEEIPFEIPENWVWCRLGEICEVNPRNISEDSTEAGFIPMPLISQTFGVKPTFETRAWSSIKKGFTHFANNDVVVAKITPCFENSKAGIISDLPNGIGAGTTEIHVLRGNVSLLSEYIYAFVKRLDFIKNGAKIMRGVAGQQRVPTEYFYNSLIPLPPLSEQQRIVAEIEKQLGKTKELKAHIIANQQATEQLLKALLRQAFLHGAFEVEEKEEK